MAVKQILFEPWSLGDALIAAAILRECSDATALACHPRWHALIRMSLPELKPHQLISVDLMYTTRSRASRLERSRLEALVLQPGSEVFSIRGDFRDYFSARDLFPGARIKMNGWVSFFARRSRLLDLPYATNLLSVRNRYRAWCDLMGVSIDKLTETYRKKIEKAPRTKRVLVHVGAQWRSKQFPWVQDLYLQLCEMGYAVRLIAGPHDPLPEGIPEGIDDTLVERLIDQALGDALRESEHVVTNDSGPMHLAALLGCRTLAVSRVSNVSEWLPPCVEAICSQSMPLGYRPARFYMSDRQLPGWPSGQEVAERISSASLRSHAESMSMERSGGIS